MATKIVRRTLTAFEIEDLVEETRHFPAIGFIDERTWRRLNTLYVLEVDGRLMGVCGVVEMEKWVKFGPLVVKAKYQHKGYGRRLLTHATGQYDGQQLFIGSSNSVVGRLAQELQFQKETNFWLLPRVIKQYLIYYFFDRLRLEFVIDGLKKLRAKRRYFFYLKKAH